MKAFLFGCLSLVVVHAASLAPLRAAEEGTTRASLDLLLVIDCGRSKHRLDVTRRATECLDCLRPGDRIRAFSCGPEGASLRFGQRFAEHDRKTLSLMLSSATPQRKLLGFLGRRADLAKGLQHVLGVLNSDGAAPGIEGSTKAVVLVTDAIRDEESVQPALDSARKLGDVGWALILTGHGIEASRRFLLAANSGLLTFVPLMSPETLSSKLNALRRDSTGPQKPGSERNKAANAPQGRRRAHPVVPEVAAQRALRNINDGPPQASAVSPAPPVAGPPTPRRADKGMAALPDDGAEADRPKEPKVPTTTPDPGQTAAQSLHSLQTTTAEEPTRTPSQDSAPTPDQSVSESERRANPATSQRGVEPTPEPSRKQGAVKGLSTTPPVPSDTRETQPTRIVRGGSVPGTGARNVRLATPHDGQTRAYHTQPAAQAVEADPSVFATLAAWSHIARNVPAARWASAAGVVCLGIALCAIRRLRFTGDIFAGALEDDGGLREVVDVRITQADDGEAPAEVAAICADPAAATVWAGTSPRCDAVVPSDPGVCARHVAISAREGFLYYKLKGTAKDPDGNGVPRGRWLPLYGMERLRVGSRTCIELSPREALALEHMESEVIL